MLNVLRPANGRSPIVVAYFTKEETQKFNGGIGDSRLTSLVKFLLMFIDPKGQGLDIFLPVRAMLLYFPL